MTYWRMQLHPADSRHAIKHSIESLAAGYIGLDFEYDVGDLMKTTQEKLPVYERDYWAFAHEMNLPLKIDDFDEIGRKTPFIASIKPSGEYLLYDFDRAGGIPAFLKELSPLLETEVLTVTGKSLAENIANAKVYEPAVIRPLESPISMEGGIAIRRSLSHLG